MPSRRDKQRTFLRSETKPNEGRVIAEIDSLMRRLRVLKDAVQGKMRPHYDGEPLTIFPESGLLDTTRLGDAVMRLYLDLERLNAATSDDPTFHLGSVHKQDGEWIYFRSGSGEESTGWHTVDGDENRNDGPDDEA
jgi:hypothetical protein